MSKSGKTKNAAQESTAECHSCSYCILMSFVIYFETSISSGLMGHLARMQTLPTFYWTRAQHQSIYLFYIIKRQKTANDIICTSVLLLIVNRTNQTARITTERLGKIHGKTYFSWLNGQRFWSAKEFHWSMPFFLNCPTGASNRIFTAKCAVGWTLD